MYIVFLAFFSLVDTFNVHTKQLNEFESPPTYAETLPATHIAAANSEPYVGLCPTAFTVDTDNVVSEITTDNNESTTIVPSSSSSNIETITATTTTKDLSCAKNYTNIAISSSSTTISDDKTVHI